MVGEAEARLCLRHFVRLFGPTLKLYRNALGADLLSSCMNREEHIVTRHGRGSVAINQGVVDDGGTALILSTIYYEAESERLAGNVLEKTEERTLSIRTRPLRTRLPLYVCNIFSNSLDRR